jgi:hypothetical protein
MVKEALITNKVNFRFLIKTAENIKYLDKNMDQNRYNLRIQKKIVKEKGISSSNSLKTIRKK